MNEQLVVLAVVIRVFPEKHGENRVIPKNVRVVRFVTHSKQVKMELVISANFCISLCRPEHVIILLQGARCMFSTHLTIFTVQQISNLARRCLKEGFAELAA